MKLHDTVACKNFWPPKVLIKILNVYSYHFQIGLGAFFKLTEYHMKVSGVMNYLPLVSLILVIFCFNSGKAKKVNCI